jgi:hypothetical protein
MLLCPVMLTAQNGVTVTFTVPPGSYVASFTDKTGAPGTFQCAPLAAPTVAQGEFCYAQSGALIAAASGDVIIAWYDASTAGKLLHTGNVLPLAPLYNNTAQYYAQAVWNERCHSARTKADYTISNCTISGTCPNYTAGSVRANNTPSACAAHYTVRA